VVSPAAVMPLARMSPCCLSRSKALAHAVAEMIVQLEQRERIRLQAPQTLLQAALDRAGHVVHFVRFQPDLAGDMGLRRQRTQMPADRFLRRAVAVNGGGVDPVDAGRDRALQRVVPDRLGCIDQDATGHAAAEGKLGYREPGAAEKSLPHCLRLSVQWVLRA
jgi:hypothetical protein